jgi:hypothetical protein
MPDFKQYRPGEPISVGDLKARAQWLAAAYRSAPGAGEGYVGTDGIIGKRKLPRPNAGFFPVLVNQVGGANGTNTTKATYTYDVTDLFGNALGTAVAVARARENGSVVLAIAPKYGVAFYSADGTLILWDAGETYGTAPCTT